MDGFHDHAKNSRLYHPALNLRFAYHEARVINLRQSTLPVTEVKERHTMGTRTETNEPAAQMKQRKEVKSTKCMTPIPRKEDDGVSMEEPCSKAPPPASKDMTASRLRNLANKISTTKSHLDFLSTCNREQLVTKGFHLKWSSHYAEQGITSGIINRASLYLVRECHRLASLKLAALSREFNMGWSQLASAGGPASGGALPAADPAMS